MIIWVDADACPAIIKEIIFRAANRTKTNTILVANQLLFVPKSIYIKSIVVSKGFDVADSYIVKNLNEKDLVITADLPLADDVVTNNAFALNPRGELYTTENIKHRLSLRNFGEALRSSGRITGGPDKISKKDIQTFANNLDKILF
ncbi:YaiI/YqxD family protein [Gammaproteobacteria bacterium]|nr:YaiI/YqxD family protein [Gammaproteobacteria bacterium]